MVDKADHQALARWAADCAERVLAHFEDSFASDQRPRCAIEAARAWARGERTVNEARGAALAAHAAARAASADAAACAAARAAGHAAATAHVIGHGPHAATYAATAAAAAAAASDDAPGGSATARAASAKERTWQRRRVPKHLLLIAFPSARAKSTRALVPRVAL